MKFKGYLSAGIVCVLFTFAAAQEALAKSVFAVASHGTSKVKAYLIDPNETIRFQATIKDTEHFGNGATGLCVWPSIDRMFVTYESDARIAWGSTKTLKRDMDDDIFAPEINLAGVIADEQNGVLYTIGRNSGHLFTYEFDIQDDTLVLTYPNGQSYRTLEGLSNAYGMALDEDGGEPYFGIPTGRLYVADGTSTVRYYNTMTWELEGSVDMVKSAVGIDVDGEGYLYAGGYGYPSHNYLVRYKIGGDPNDSETLIEKDMETVITDIIIDRDTGLLYTTTRRVVDGRTGAVEVYDVSNWISTDPDSIVRTDIESDSEFGGPAGIGIGSQYKPDNGMYIAKIDDVEDPNGCVVPDNTYNYTIAFHLGPVDEPNVVITDSLPEGVDFVSADPNTGTYYPSPEHKYVWELGDVSGYDPNTWTGGDPNQYFELTVQVNNYAEPGGTLYNKVTAESDWSYVDADESTRVCCWGGDVIYVDRNAPGPHIGTSWQTAYLDLAEGLERARAGCGSIILIADGTYKPGIDPSNDFFDVPDSVSVYGGYIGYGASDPNEYDTGKYKTILNGYISEDEWGNVTRNNTVVKMGDDSLLDGVTVEEGNYQGIDASDVSSTIKNCTITNNEQKGIYCIDGDVTVQWCEITENGWQGVHHRGIDYQLDVSNCNIHDNLYDGVLTEESTCRIKNSLIYLNGSGEDYYGIYIENPSSSPDVHNNTIVHNVNEGIKFVGTNAPDVRNNILYYNGGDSQLAGLNSDTDADYCCIQDCNEIPTNSNINDEPGFAYDASPYGYYHLNYDSPCRDAGDDDAVDTGDMDMDADDRIADSHVDIGADEITCEDTSDPNDWNFDGAINLEEFFYFSEAWLTHDPNDPVCIADPNQCDPNAFANWNPVCNLDTSGTSEYNIDLADLTEFIDNSYWLWEACWREGYISAMSAMAGGGESMMMPMSMTMESSIPAEPTVEEPVISAESIEEIIGYVDIFIEEDSTNVENLYGMKDYLEELLIETQE